jgi:hypothetical protein
MIDKFIVLSLVEFWIYGLMIVYAIRSDEYRTSIRDIISISLVILMPLYILLMIILNVAIFPNALASLFVRQCLGAPSDI